MYQQGDAPIAGLDDGSTYYVAASTNQTNLQGNTRFADAQVIGLAETENEARGGVLIDLGRRSPGDRLQLRGEARPRLGLRDGRRHHRRSSTRRTRRVGERRARRARTRTRTCGRSSRRSLGTNVPDKLFTKLTKPTRATRRRPSRLARTSSSVAGALAFSSATTMSTTVVGPTAVIKSNEDLEVKATITQSSR